MQNPGIVLGQSLWKQTSTHLWLGDELQIRNTKCTDLELGLQVGRFLKGLFQLALHLPAPTCFLLCFDFTLLTNKWLPSMRPLCKNLDSENHKSIISLVYYHSISWDLINTFRRRDSRSAITSWFWASFKSTDPIVGTFSYKRMQSKYLSNQYLFPVLSPSAIHVHQYGRAREIVGQFCGERRNIRYPKCGQLFIDIIKLHFVTIHLPVQEIWWSKWAFSIYLASTYSDWWKNHECLKNHPPCQSLIWLQAGAQVCSTLFKTSLIKFNLHKKIQTFTVSDEYFTAS